eukprot:316825-Pleurochrysis_carterae.AAC.2
MLFLAMILLADDSIKGDHGMKDQRTECIFGASLHLQLASNERALLFDLWLVHSCTSRPTFSYILQQMHNQPPVGVTAARWRRHPHCHGTNRRRTTQLLCQASGLEVDTDSKFSTEWLKRAGNEAAESTARKKSISQFSRALGLQDRG